MSEGSAQGGEEMKKVGSYTARGRLKPPAEDNDEVRIQLFDGRFDTGYRVVRFEIAPAAMADPNGDTVTAKLTTDLIGTDDWNWDDEREIAWSIGTYAMSGALPFGFKSWIDPENMIVEDLYIYANSGFEGSINYVIEMEKYEITDWQGALAMVRNRSQA